jgi:divalent metal cation (Fe/Co/Zn/Cd) transporter
VYEGLRTIISGGESSRMLWINYPVLAFALVFEAVSLRQAVRQTRGEARQRRRSLRAVVREPHDPTVRSVLLEDSAAVTGVIVAAVGVGLHQLTGSAMWDGAASLAIGAVLVVAAVLLAQACKALLVGRQADPRLMRSIETVLEQQDEVDDVVDLLTMLTGADRVLVCTRVDFADGFTTSELEQACVRIDRTLRERFSDLDEIFIQPAPKWDPQVRARVRARYGHELAGR